MNILRTLSKNSSITLVELPPTQFGIYNGNAGFDVYTKFKLPPRALPYLHATLLADNWQNVRSISPIFHGRNGKLTKENEKRIFTSEVLCVSSISRTSPQSMELLRRYKKFNPNGIAIAGGFDPTFRTEQWLKFADIVVIGEAEKTFAELMYSLTVDPNSIQNNKHRLDNIKGIAFKKGDKVQINEKRELLTSEELGKLPHPYYDKQIRKKAGIATIETGKGCPNACEFCSVTEFYGRKYRKKPVAYVIEELKRIKSIGSDLFFLDDNIAADSKWAIELFEAMASNGLNNRWASAQVTVKVAENPALIAAMKKANVRGLYIGIESINDASLGSLGKPYSAKQNMDNIKKLREEGFWIHGMMIFGADGDTRETLQKTSHWINDNLDSLQLFPPTPLPGTKLYYQMSKQNRIITHDLSLYDCQMVVFRPKNFTPYELQRAIYKMYESFYSPIEIFKRFFRSPKKLLTIAIFIFLYLLGGKKGMLHSPQARRHMSFLKSIK